jgi:hypothetical protein
MEFMLSGLTDFINMRVSYSGGAIKVSLRGLTVTFCNCCDTFIIIQCEPGYAMNLMTMNGVATGGIKLHIEVSDSKSLAPDKKRIQELVYRTYGITKGERLMSQGV